MKNLKKVLALVLAVVMIMGTVAVASAKDYTDVKTTDTYADAIDILSSLGILDGFTDGTFKPEGTLTRAQAAKMVAIVHNAATNGKIKGQDAISELYGNAQNAFTDCTGNWAVAYINYCRATGLLDGITRTTYAPNSKLTGVQWLKLMLTTLNFNTDKEGYLGAGWDVNVLNRANEIGLTDGLADGWKGNVPVTRGEAAQILVNALNSYLVEYGQLIKGYPTTEAQKTGKYPYKASFVSNEQVSATEKKLGEKAGLEITTMLDVFGRPGTMWFNTKTLWSKFYPATPLASFTTAVTTCDILVGAGIPKTNSTPITYVTFVNGAYTSTRSLTTLSHANRLCEDTSKTPVFGNTGALTQIYKVGGIYVITTIDTLLAKVTKVATNATHGNGGVVTTLNVYNRGASYNNVLNDSGVLSFEPKFQTSTSKNGTTVKAAGLEGYAAGSYVLVHMSTMNPTALTGLEVYQKDLKLGIYTDDTVVETSATTKASAGVYKAEVDNKAFPTYLVDVKAADSKTQKLTGRGNDAWKITLDGEQVPTAHGYILDEVNVMTNALAGKSATFFRDQYENAIGDVLNATEYAYGVLTGIYWQTYNATYSDSQKALAGFVKAGDNETSDIVVTKVNNKTLMGVTENNKNIDADLDPDLNRNIYGAGEIDYGTVSPIKGNNPSYTSSYHAYGVVKYVLDANGNYELTYAPQSDILSVNQITSTKPELTAGYVADENTVFVVKTLKAGAPVYTSYTGIKNVPTILQPVAVVAYKDGKDFVPFVYVDATNSIFAGSTAVAYVTDVTPSYAEAGVVYSYDNVYIDGVKTTISVYKAVASDADEMFKGGTGLYAIAYDADGKVCNATKLTATAADKIAYAQIATVSGNVVKNSYVDPHGSTAINVENAKVYFVLTNGAGTKVEVVEKTVADLTAGMSYRYTYSGSTNWVANTIYVENIPFD